MAVSSPSITKPVSYPFTLNLLYLLYLLHLLYLLFLVE
jgi:hypothetical protein